MEVPRYSHRELNSWWYHQLYGHVPGAEQEKILEPTPDSELLAAPHIQLAWRSLSALAPRLDEGIGLAFVNLSTQPQPGSGGMAVILALRTLRGSGIVDHQGREGALVRHGIIAVNRLMDMLTLNSAATALVRHATGSTNLAKTVSVPTKAEYAESARRVEGPIDAWYGNYCQNAQWSVNERKKSLIDYLRTFRTLPQLHRPRLEGQYIGGKANKLIYVEYDEATPLIDLIAYASQLAAALHMSNFSDSPWSSVEIGTKLTDPIDHGLTIRFVPNQLVRRDAPGARFNMHKQMPEPAQRDAIPQMRKLMQEMFNANWERQVPQTGPRSRPPLPTEEQVDIETITVADSAITPQLDGGAVLTVPAPIENLTIALSDGRDAAPLLSRSRGTSVDEASAQSTLYISQINDTRLDVPRLPHETAANYALGSMSPTKSPATGQMWTQWLIRVTLAVTTLSFFALAYLVHDAVKGFKQLRSVEKLNNIEERLNSMPMCKVSQAASAENSPVRPAQPGQVLSIQPPRTECLGQGCSQSNTPEKKETKHSQRPPANPNGPRPTTPPTQPSSKDPGDTSVPRFGASPGGDAQKTAGTGEPPGLGKK